MVRVKHVPFPDELRPDPSGLVMHGGELHPDVLIEAYQRGIFPWSGHDPIPWCAPNPRLVLPPTKFHASRSLRKLARSTRFTITFDRDFTAVMRACAETPRAEPEGTWITPNMIAVYTELFHRHIAHSVEVRANGELVGGLYGLTFGRAFFGESMFHRAPNASKLALFALCQRLAERDFHFVDCQAITLHLMSLGAVPIPLSEYLRRLHRALAFPSFHEEWTGW